MDAPIIAPSNFLVLPSLSPLRQCCHRSREMKKAAALAPLLWWLEMPRQTIKEHGLASTEARSPVRPPLLQGYRLSMVADTGL